MADMQPVPRRVQYTSPVPHRAQPHIEATPATVQIVKCRDKELISEDGLVTPMTHDMGGVVTLLRHKQELELGVLVQHSR